MASSFCLVSVISLFVAGGSTLSIVTKILFMQEAPGKDGEVKPFQKPWFIMLMMSVAMSTSLLKWAVDQRRDSRSLSHVSMRKVGLKLVIPAFLTNVGSFVQAVGLLWTPVSVYQMLQSSIIIFSAVIRFCWMGKGLWRFELFGIVLTAFGLVTVGVASIVSGSDAANFSLGEQITGICCVLVSQAIMALEAVVEERAMHASSAAPEFVCGMVGAWGILIVGGFFMPIAQFLPGAEGKGLREDTMDTFVMLQASNVQILCAGFFFVVFLYNHTMRLLIGLTQATTMQVLGGLRTLFVWVIALLMYLQWPQYGEAWTWQTWIKLAGFVMLMFGVFVYKATFKLHCFRYPETGAEKGAQESSTSLVVAPKTESA